MRYEYYEYIQQGSRSLRRKATLNKVPWGCNTEALGATVLLLSGVFNESTSRYYCCPHAHCIEHCLWRNI